MLISASTVGGTAETWLNLCLLDDSDVAAKLRIKYHYSSIAHTVNCSHEIENQRLGSFESQNRISASLQHDPNSNPWSFLMTQNMSKRIDEEIPPCRDELKTFDEWRVIPKLARKVAGLMSPKSKHCASKQTIAIGDRKIVTVACSSWSYDSCSDDDSVRRNLEMHAMAENYPYLSVCVEIDSISASNLRKNPAIGLNPSPYICISLISNTLLSHVNAGRINHSCSRAEFKNIPSCSQMSSKYFEIQEQYRSAVVHRSQVPVWRSIFFLDEVIDISHKCDSETERCEVYTTRRPLVGQAITMLITIYDHISEDKDRFLGKVLIPLEKLGKDYDQKFDFLDLDGSLIDSSQGYLWITCKYKLSTRHRMIADSDSGSHFDISATTSSTCSSDSSISVTSSNQEEEQAQCSDWKFPRLLPSSFDVRPCSDECRGDINLPASCQDEESECSLLRTNRSMETLCGVFEPLPSLIHGNSFESEHLLSNKTQSYLDVVDVTQPECRQSGFEPAMTEAKQRISDQAPRQNAIPDARPVHLANTTTQMVQVARGADVFPVAPRQLSGDFVSSSNIQPSPSQHIKMPLNWTIFQRTTSEPYRTQSPATLLVTQKKATVTLQSPATIQTSDNQFRRSQSAQDWCSPITKIKSNGNNGTNRVAYDLHEPSELEKAFIARKLIPSRDLNFL